MHFFVAYKEMHCSYVTFYRRNDQHLRLLPLKTTSDDPANLLRTQRINFSMRPQHCRLMFPIYMTAATAWVYPICI